MGCCYGNRLIDMQADFEMKERGQVQITVEETAIGGLHRSPLKVDSSLFPQVLQSPSDLEGMPVVTTQIPKEEIETAPLLELEVIESPTLPRGQKYSINAGGYIHSTRYLQNGYVYMGTSEEVSDIVVPSEEIGMGSVHLMIRYDTEKRAYFIRDYGQGTGTFAKIEEPLELQSNFIVSFGDSHMHIILESLDHIKLKFLEGAKADQLFTFHKNDGLITIGRMTGCNIKFDDYSLSRNQCCLEFYEGKWVLMDGDGSKFSTNGTWLFVEDYFPLKDGIIFKAGQSLFKSHLIHP